MTMTINVKFIQNKAYCSLCTGHSQKVDTHLTYNSLTYTIPSSKISRLESLNRCTKCGNLSYKSIACNFRLAKRCFRCSQWHFSFLCNPIKPKTKNKKSTHTKNEDTKKQEIVNKKIKIKRKVKTKFHPVQYGQKETQLRFTLIQKKTPYCRFLRQN